jgi:hypothetical protein
MTHNYQQTPPSARLNPTSKNRSRRYPGEQPYETLGYLQEEWKKSRTQKKSQRLRRTKMNRK